MCWGGHAACPPAIQAAGRRIGGRDLGFLSHCTQLPFHAVPQGAPRAERRPVALSILEQRSRDLHPILQLTTRPPFHLPVIARPQAKAIHYKPTNPNPNQATMRRMSSILAAALLAAPAVLALDVLPGDGALSGGTTTLDLSKGTVTNEVPENAVVLNLTPGAGGCYTIGEPTNTMAGEFCQKADAAVEKGPTIGMSVLVAASFGSPGASYCC